MVGCPCLLEENGEVGLFSPDARGQLQTSGCSLTPRRNGCQGACSYHTYTHRHTDTHRHRHTHTHTHTHTHALAHTHTRDTHTIGPELAPISVYLRLWGVPQHSTHPVADDQPAAGDGRLWARLSVGRLPLLLLLEDARRHYQPHSPRGLERGARRSLYVWRPFYLIEWWPRPRYNQPDASPAPFLFFFNQHTHTHTHTIRSSVVFFHGRA